MAVQQIFPSHLVRMRYATASDLDNQYRCPIAQCCLWPGQEVRANPHTSVAVVTVTVLHTPILAFTHVEAWHCTLPNRLPQLCPHYLAPSLSLKLRLLALSDALAHGRKKQLKLLLALHMMFWKPVELVLATGEEGARRTTSTFPNIPTTAEGDIHSSRLYIFLFPFLALLSRSFCRNNMWRNCVLIHSCFFIPLPH
jgi:hypothetical protein